MRSILPLLKYHLKIKVKSFATYSSPGHLSYLSVPGKKPLLGLNIGQLLDVAGDVYGDGEAVVFNHQSIRRSFQQIRKETDDLAEGLLRLGLEKGDRVGIWGPNSHEWYLTHMAVAKAGLVLVNLNPAYQGREVLYAINRVGIKCMILDTVFKSQNYYDILASVVPGVLKGQPGRIQEAPSLSHVITMGKQQLQGTYLFEEVLFSGSKGHGSLGKVTVGMDDLFNVQFTSGTTGNPKGVMLTHHNLVNNSFVISQRLNYTQKDRLCVAVPLFHCYGGVGAMMAALHSGSALVFPSPGFDPLKAIQAVATEKCTALYGTPTMHVDMTSHPQLKSLGVNSLRYAVTAGSTCPEDLAKQMKDKYGLKEGVVSYYGLTETSPVVFQSLPDDGDELRNTSVGYPQEHTEVKIVDAEGRIVPVGMEGELCARGYMTMLGYWDEPKKTAEVLTPSRWFHTGDTFVMTKSGHARVVGRSKDMIIRGGENIYPKEVEEFLHSHPDILEVHVFGVRDERMGEEVAVWVRVQEGVQLTDKHVRDFCKGQIAHFKIPKYISFRSDFPKTTSGKIQKFLMRDETEKALAGAGKGETRQRS